MRTELFPWESPKQYFSPILPVGPDYYWLKLESGPVMGPAHALRCRKTPIGDLLEVTETPATDGQCRTSEPG